MARYHISEKTQRPNICRAQPGRCPLGAAGEDVPHFESKEEARAFVEKSNEEKYGAVPQSASKSSDTKSSGAPAEEPRTLIETNALSLRAGDVLHGEKFSFNQDMDDDKEIAKVEEELDLSMKTRVKITYVDGKEAYYGPRSPVRVKRKNSEITDAPEVDPLVVRKDLRSASRKVDQGVPLEQKEVDKVLNGLRSPKATLELAARADKLADSMTDNNQHHDATLVAASATRIRLSKDSSYEFKDSTAYDLLYDRENTSPELFKKLSADFPRAAKNAEENRKRRGMD